VTAARPDRAVLLVAIVIAAAIFTISFGFVADADRGTSTTATPRTPGQQPASRHAATGPARGERVTLGAAPGLRVRASLLAPQVRPVRRARARRVAPAPSPGTSVPSPSTEAPVPPVDGSAPVAPAPSSTAPSPPPAAAPVPAPAPTPVAPKPHPKPAAKPKPPKSPDFDDSGPPAPAKRQPGSR
jgi:hypothetical protein